MSDLIILSVNSTTLKQATNFIHYLERLGPIKQPNITVNDDEEINFLWYTNPNEFTLDVGFKGYDHYFYYCKLSDGTEFIEDTANLKWPLPDEIIVELRK